MYAVLLCCGWILIGGVWEEAEATEQCPPDYNVPSGGVLTSPNYPNEYFSNMDCYWVIRAPYLHHIRLEFDRITLEQEQNCGYDWVEIHESSLSGKLLGKFCGNENVGILTAFSDKVYIRMKTDGRGIREGFFLKYEFISQLHEIKAIHGSPIDVCASSFTQGSIEITDVLLSHSHDVNCTWLINTFQNDNQTLLLSFPVFFYPNLNNCEGSRLEISDADQQSITYCDGIRPVFRSKTGQVRVNFFSSSHMEYRKGFKLIYRRLEAADGCRETLMENNGTVTSPNYPRPHHRECEWTIQAPPNHVIQYSFTDLNISSKFDQLCRMKKEDAQFVNCSDDQCNFVIRTAEGKSIQSDNIIEYFHRVCLNESLEVWDGTITNMPSFTYCGGHIPSQLLSQSNTLNVYSLGTNNPPIFKLRYKFVCGKTFQAGEGTLEHNATDQHYFLSDNQTCKYTIQTAEYKLILFNVTANSLSQGSVVMQDGTRLVTDLIAGTEGRLTTSNRIVISVQASDKGSFRLTFRSLNKYIKPGDQVYLSRHEFCDNKPDDNMFPVIDRHIRTTGLIRPIEQRDLVTLGGSKGLSHWIISGDVRLGGHVSLENQDFPGRFLSFFSCRDTLTQGQQTVLGTCETSMNLTLCPAPNTSAGTCLSPSLRSALPDAQIGGSSRYKPYATLLPFTKNVL